MTILLLTKFHQKVLTVNKNYKISINVFYCSAKYFYNDYIHYQYRNTNSLYTVFTTRKSTKPFELRVFIIIECIYLSLPEYVNNLLSKIY